MMYEPSSHLPNKIQAVEKGVYVTHCETKSYSVWYCQRVRNTIESILVANVICNPYYIFVGHLFIIPEPEILLLKAGGTPYYVVNYRDTLWCLANQFSQSVESLAATNQLTKINQNICWNRIACWHKSAESEELYAAQNISEEQYEFLNSQGLFGVYYLGSFQCKHLVKEHYLI